MLIFSLFFCLFESPRIHFPLFSFPYLFFSPFRTKGPLSVFCLPVFSFPFLVNLGDFGCFKALKSPPRPPWFLSPVFYLFLDNTAQFCGMFYRITTVIVVSLWVILPAWRFQVPCPFRLQFPAFFPVGGGSSAFFFQHAPLLPHFSPHHVHHSSSFSGSPMDLFGNGFVPNNHFHPFRETYPFPLSFELRSLSRSFLHIHQGQLFARSAVDFFSPTFFFFYLQTSLAS